MSTVRLTPPPIQVDANDFTFKKWFQEVYQYSQGGVLIPTVDSTIQQYGGYRNLLINGSFQINQRGANSYNNGAATSYTVDRWAIGARTAGTYFVQYPVAGPPGFPKAVEISRTAVDTSTAEIFFVNMSESKNSIAFAGKKIVLSFWLKCSAGFSGIPFTPAGAANSETFEVHIQSGTGTDEGPLAALTGSADVIRGYLIPTTTWTYYQFTGTVPANSNELKTYFGWAPPASVTPDNSVFIAGVQVEIARDQSNPVATAFEYIPFDVELERCRRYYQKSFGYTIAPTSGSGNATGALGWISSVAGAAANYSQTLYYQPRMRISPILTFYNYNAANAQAHNLNTGTDSSSVTTTGFSSADAFHIAAVGIAGWAVGNLLAVHWSAEGEL